MKKMRKVDLIDCYLHTIMYTVKFHIVEAIERFVSVSMHGLDEIQVRSNATCIFDSHLFSSVDLEHKF